MLTPYMCGHKAEVRRPHPSGTQPAPCPACQEEANEDNGWSEFNPAPDSEWGRALRL